MDFKKKKKKSLFILIAHEVTVVSAYLCSSKWTLFSLYIFLLLFSKGCKVSKTLGYIMISDDSTFM